MYIYGKNVAKETLESNNKIVKAIICEDFSDQDLILALKEKQINIKRLSKKEFYKLDNNNNQGIILEVPDYKYSLIHEVMILARELSLFSISIPVEFASDVYVAKVDWAKEKPFIVILDHIEDPHNFGAIVRTCEAAGVDGIIITKDRCVSVNSTVMKTSAGALNNVKICMVTNLNNTIKELKKRGLWIVGTDMANSSLYTQIDYDMPIALVIGSEGFGMSRLIKESCDYIVNIPMNGKVNSLNASVAAGILIYKIIEKRT